ncbi:hypothetical protein IF1G_09809 [Cordyceps javanica]|uniref:Transmembrane protein n=1 Tax=Cordyceps javanica TaxID=43265 RepID=A0A545UQK2_9HYPO|nr:hypothetical protein IF1G_09809 [Cordyceps javanica]
MRRCPPPPRSSLWPCAASGAAVAKAFFFFGALLSALLWTVGCSATWRGEKGGKQGSERQTSSQRASLMIENSCAAMQSREEEWRGAGCRLAEHRRLEQTRAPAAAPEMNTPASAQSVLVVNLPGPPIVYIHPRYVRGCRLLGTQDGCCRSPLITAVVDFFCSFLYLVIDFLRALSFSLFFLLFCFVPRDAKSTTSASVRSDRQTDSSPPRSILVYHAAFAQKTKRMIMFFYGMPRMMQPLFVPPAVYRPVSGASCLLLLARRGWVNFVM